MINPTALLDDTGYINNYLYKERVYISHRSTHNNTASYDNITTQSLRITYDNTDDIAGHYIHMAYAYHFWFNTSTCSDYYIWHNRYSTRIPVFTLYWNIRSYGKFILIRNTIHDISFSVCI